MNTEEQRKMSLSENIIVMQNSSSFIKIIGQVAIIIYSGSHLFNIVVFISTRVTIDINRTAFLSYKNCSNASTDIH